MDKLSIQLEAVNNYIERLIKCEQEDRDIKFAYQDLVNDYRLEAGKKPFKYQNLK